MSRASGGATRAAGAAAPPGETLVPSRFNVVVDLGADRAAVYNTHTGGLLVVSAPVGHWLRGAASPGGRGDAGSTVDVATLAILRRHGALCAAGLDELALVRWEFERVRHDPTQQVVEVIPTRRCNLSCAYCFNLRPGGPPPGPPMSAAVENAAVLTIAALCRGRRALHLEWFGGEPLLALRSVRRITEQLGAASDRLGVTLTAGMSTNGTLLDDRHARALRDLRIGSLQVTVDVPRALKRDGAGRDTRRRALDGAAAAAAYLPVALAVNVGRDDEAEFADLYEQLGARGLQRSLGRFTLRPVRDADGACQAAREFDALDLPAWEVVERRERRRAVALGLPVELLPHGPVGPCAATRNCHVVIAPDGVLYRCHHDVGDARRACGRVQAASAGDWQSMAPYLAYDWFAHEECRSCVLLPRCAGGCPYRRMNRHREAPGTPVCRLTLLANLEDRVRQAAELQRASRPGAVAG